MADIFISYKSSERPIVAEIADGLRRAGFTVWWDHALVGGQDYSEIIAQEIAAARIVMPIWSNESVRSQWVRAEADEGAGKLFPVRIDAVKIPLPHNKLHTIDLSAWTGDTEDTRWQRLVADLKAVLSGEAPASRPGQLAASKPRRGTIMSLGAAAGLVAIAVAALPALREMMAGAPAAGRPNASAVSAPAAAPMQPLSAQICEAGADGLCAGGESSCGSRSVRLGQMICVRITSPVAGSVVLIDRSADGSATAIYPNGLSAEGASLRVEVGQPLVVPRASHGFRFKVGGPKGASRLTIAVMPIDYAFPSYFEKIRGSRAIEVVPAERRADLDQVLADASKTLDLPYDVLP